MPRFDADVGRLMASSDDVFGEELVLRPFAANANPNAPAAPDPTRGVLRLVGLWRDKPVDPREPNAWDSREYRRPGVAGDAPTVEFSAAALSCAVGLEIRDGDQIERLSNRGRYLVLGAPVFTANGTMRVRLNRLN